MVITHRLLPPRLRPTRAFHEELAPVLRVGDVPGGRVAGGVGAPEVQVERTRTLRAEYEHGRLAAAAVRSGCIADLVKLNISADTKI